MNRRLLRISTLLLSAIASASPAQTTGGVEGKIANGLGEPLPGVSVSATSESLQGVRSQVTGLNGSYRFAGLPPGVYRITAKADGFQTSGDKATVSLDSLATLNFTLQLAAREEVLVSGATPLVDVTSTTSGTNYVQDVIVRLPVARNYADIVRANPGVSTDQGETQGRSLALTIYGASSVENQWYVDGINTTNVIKGFQGKAINSEFIQEVEVKTGGYQAEYGRALGGIINAITKSGGNQFHGDGFVYYDSTDSTAAQKITSQDSVEGMRVADYERTDFGADLGGFLLRDRLWFFAAYDRVQTPARVARYVSSDLVPASQQFPLYGRDSLYSGKLTWSPSAATTLVATAFSDPTFNSGAGAADPRGGSIDARLITNPDPGTWEASRSIGGLDYALRANQLFSSAALLTLQGSHHRDRYDLETVGDGSAVSVRDFLCVGGTQTQRCSSPRFPNFVTGGYGPIFGPTDRNTSTRDQVRGDLTLFPNAHEIKVGFDFEDEKTHAITSFSGKQIVSRLNEWGQLYYKHSFFAVNPNDLTPIDNRVSPKTRELAAYAQDSWRVASGLTVNAGIRWDEQDIRDYRDVSVIKTTGEWQPRLGIAWDPTGSGKTKLSAFAGRFYYSLPSDLAVRAYGAQTNATTYNFDPASLVQDPSVFMHGSPVVRGSAFSEPVDRGLKGGFQDEFTVGVERLLDPTFSIALKGIYRRLGRAIEDRCDLDYTQPLSNDSSCAVINPGSNGTFARGDFLGCNGLDDAYYECMVPVGATPPARRLYRGIEILTRKAIGEKLWLQASYVYSSLRGNYDGGVSQIEAGQTDPGINADFDYAAYIHNSYGRLYGDRPHRARFDGYYVTRWKVWVGVQAWIQSGAPLSRIGYFGQGFSDVQLVPKGTEGRLPTTWDSNLIVGCPLAVGPVTVTAELYIFNLFNNQIRTSQDMDWSSTNPPTNYPASLFDPNQQQNNPDYGKITSRQPPRLVRGSLKISF